MIIREYKPEDREAIEKCIFEFHQGEYELNPEYWVSGDVSKEYFDYLSRKIKEGNGKIFIAENDGMIVGYVAVRIEEDDSPRVAIKKNGYISNIVVLKEYQGKGFGVALLKQAEDFSKEMGATYIFLDVTIEKPAVEFYLKHGYKKQSVYMEKKLN